MLAKALSCVKRRPPCLTAHGARDSPHRANAKSRCAVGWQRQAESSELGDGGFLMRRTIAKAFGLDAATH